MSFGEKLKKLRESKDIKQEDLSKMLNVDRSTVGKWENNTSKPDFEKLLKISKYFEVSTDFLLGVEQKNTQDEQISKALIDDDELISFWKTLKEREDLKLMMKQIKDLPENDIKTILRIIKSFEKENET